jgi:hypothetical protein
MPAIPNRSWNCAYELDERQRPAGGSVDALVAAVRRGADIRIYTTFDWLDHMGSSADFGLIEETIDLRVTYLLEDRWMSALTALRYPAEAGLGFGTDPSLSFYMYNQDGRFGIARPYFQQRALRPRTGEPLNRLANRTPHYRVIDAADQETESPSHNAVYDFGCIRWLVRDDWTQVLNHDKHGVILDGSLDALCEAFRRGCSVKVIVRNLCDFFVADGTLIEHEVAVELGSMYLHTQGKFHSGESLPLVRIAPAIPLAYRSGNWNFGWILSRTDGCVFHLAIDPRTREISQTEGRYAIRWLVR